MLPTSSRYFEQITQTIQYFLYLASTHLWKSVHQNVFLSWRKQFSALISPNLSVELCLSFVQSILLSVAVIQFSMYKFNSATILRCSKSFFFRNKQSIHLINDTEYVVCLFHKCVASQNFS